MLKNRATCKGCGREIEWVETPAGARMPVDLEVYVVKFDPGSTGKYISVESGGVIPGHVVGHDPLDPRVGSDGHFVGRTPHWATCPAGARFRRGRKKHENKQHKSYPVTITE